MKLDLTLDRTGIEGIEERNDADVILDWLRAALASSPAQVDPFFQMLWDRVLRDIETAGKAKHKEIELEESEALMLKLTLIRANFKAEGMRMYLQLLAKFGIKLG